MDGKAELQHWINIILGAWLFISPFVLGYTEGPGLAAWNAYIFGIAILVFAVWSVLQPKVWEDWVNLGFGFWVLVAPLVLGYREAVVPLWNDMIVGILVIANTLWAVRHEWPRVADRAGG